MIGPARMPIADSSDFYGTELFGATKDDRLGKCYELSARAMLFGTAPAGARLVHGSVHHIYVSRRIDHAWLVLPSGMVWEPISGNVWIPAAWQHIARAQIDASYTLDELLGIIVTHKHYGPWHISSTHNTS